MGVKILEYRRFDKTIIVRLDKGEEILEQVKELALKERIKLASVQEIGRASCRERVYVLV